MHVEEHRWFSRHLNRDMALKVYGHWGLPLLVFPCSRGRYFDYETMGMVAAISGFIEGGRVKLFCVDSVDSDSWYNFSVPPWVRNDRHEAYDRYVADEVIPFIRTHCNQPDAKPLTNGCSMGAYHSLNFFLKHPDLCSGTIALSGLYRLDHPEFGVPEAEIGDIYFNSPIHYLPGLTTATTLDQYRNSRIVLCVGQGAWEDEMLADTRQMEAIFQNLSVPAWIDIWGLDVNHDWPWWYKQMNYFLGGISAGD
jgi:esterase/lipase superfamily enzyme